VNARFTVDGSQELESRLAKTCGEVLAAVQKLIPAEKLEALVLGGGYGRGQGGVRKTKSGDKPYNDLEFYVFIRGNVHVSERTYNAALHELGERLSSEAGLHVEFKVYSVEKLRSSPISMFTYDLVAGHKLIFGGEEIFQECQHHLIAKDIPLHEATRLLFNRCSGLLLAKDFLRNPELTPEQQDFVGRNIAKAQLAFGDVVLAVYGRYHSSCLERAGRLNKNPTDFGPPALGEIQRLHALGVDFKLHPCRTKASQAELLELHAQTAKLGLQLWLWAESRRLDRPFATAQEYALSPLSKCPESVASRNALLNLRTFGAGAMLDRNAFRYPRERLLNALCLMLWDEATTLEKATQWKLPDLLRAKSANWPDLIQAYQNLWQRYG